MNNTRTDKQINTTLSFISREVPQPKYEANQADKGIDAKLPSATQSIMDELMYTFQTIPIFQMHWRSAVLWLHDCYSLDDDHRII